MIRRVLAMGFILSVAISNTARVAAQIAPSAEPPSVEAEDRAPAQAAFPPLEPAPAPAPASPAPAPPSVTVAAAPGSASSHRTGAAPAREQVAVDGQANFGVGAQVGFFNPNGLAVRVGFPAIAIEATAGFVPVLLSYRSYSRYEDNELKFLLPFEVSPQLVIHAVTFKHDMRGNLLLGYRYNRALGQGITLGGEIESRVTRKLVLQGLWGVSFYPDASDHLRRDRVPSDAEFKFPPWLGYGLSVGLLFYP